MEYETRYLLQAPQDVRAFRIVTQAGNAFDELEAGPRIAADLDTALTALGGFQFLGTGPKDGDPPFPVPTFQDGNIARAGDALPFASQTRAGHGVEKLNNGLYGDSEGWNAENSAVTIPRSYAGYAGIYWTGGLRRVEEIAVGRDNKGANLDRHDGAFAVHYTTGELDFSGGVEDAPAVAAAKWIAIGTLRSHPIETNPGPPDVTEMLRHVYELTTPIEARAIRVSAWPAALGTVFDELEIFGAGPAPRGQLAGDCNQDGTVNLSDVICLVGHLFQGDPSVLSCSTTEGNLALMDSNLDGKINLSDAIYLVAWLFQGGPAPVQGVDCFDIGGCPQNPGCP